MVKFNSKALNVQSAAAVAEVRKYQQGVEPYAAYVRIEVFPAGQGAEIIEY